jgi:Ser/Thr protein kinase RdoA (MazF antagonist)
MAVRFAGEADQDFLGLAKRVADRNFEVETRKSAEIFTIYY